jgi:hypothetical protein
MVKKLTTAVAGMQFYSQTIRKPLHVGDALALVRDPENPHDRNAVRIQRSEKEILGFIPKELAASVAKELDSGRTGRAFIYNLFYGIPTIAVVLSHSHSEALDSWLERTRALRVLEFRLEAVMRRIAENNRSSAGEQIRELHFVLAKHLLAEPERNLDGIHFLGYAALNGHSEAKKLVDKLYLEDTNGEWTYSLAQAGHAEAQYRQADEYFWRKRSDIPRAVKYWRLAAEQGHLRSQQRLALLYEIGDGVPKDPEQATYWRGMAAAAQARVDSERSAGHQHSQPA